VSLYNESPAGAIDPTPTVGMVGIIEDPAHVTTQAFKAPGDAILLLGGTGSEIGASHYLLTRTGQKSGAPPALDFDRERALHDALRELIRAGLVRSAHDCSEGGLAVALAECCLSAPEPLGCEAVLPLCEGRADLALFNESQSRIVVSCAPEHAPEALNLLERRGIEARQIGTVTSSDPIAITVGNQTVHIPGKPLRAAWLDTIGNLMSGG
jgi:phosphoribosylformylglycinamidine synthase subunit PurL